MSIEAEKRLVQSCLTHLESLITFQAKYAPLGDGESGDGLLRLHNEDMDLVFSANIKKNISPRTISSIVSRSDLITNNFDQIVLAESIPPGAAEQLQNHGLNYVDTLGNIFIHSGSVYINIMSRRRPSPKRPKNLFNTASSKLITYFLADPERVNERYRNIALDTGIALGSIGWIIQDLRKRDYIRSIGKRQRHMVNRRQLFERWLEGYHERLRPKLLEGTFSSVRRENIEDIAGQAEEMNILLGGEYAAGRMVGWLHPATLTLHVFDNMNEVRKNLGLYPDPEGTITLLDGFGRIEASTTRGEDRALVDPVLVYAELMDMTSERVLKAAREIFDTNLEQILEDK